MPRVLPLAALAALCATTAPAQPSAPIPREHAETVAAFGGLMTGPAADYVAQVGERVAVAAGKPNQCAFHLLSSEVVNAFTAPPGCHVYVTRGLLTLVNGEEEVAGVIGHEIGHVAANHAGRRQQRSALTGIGAQILGAVTKSDLVGAIANQAGQLYVLSYSRSQEYESDDLSVKYLTASGRYSPYGIVDLLGALQRQDRLEQRTAAAGAKAQQTPSWARSHPLTGDRIARAAQKAGEAGGKPGIPVVNQDAFFKAIDGLPVGQDTAAQGVVEGRSFVHPGLGVAFTAPQGYALTNTDKAVNIQGPNGVRAVFSGGPLQGGLEDYARTTLTSLVGSAPMQMGQPQRTTVNGVEAVILPAQARSQSGMVDLVVAAYGAGGQGAYHFITMAPPGQGEAASQELIGSFRRLTSAEAAAVGGGRRIQVVTAKAGDTAQTLAERMAYPDYRLERFALLNNLDASQTLTPGQRVKLITTSPAPPPTTSRPPSRPTRR